MGSIKNIEKKTIGHEKCIAKKFGKDLVERYHDRLEKMFVNLNLESKDLLVELIAYRILGHKKIKSQRNNDAYRKAVKLAATLADTNDR